MKSAIFAVTFSLAVGSAVHGQENQPLRLVAKIPVPTMTGTWDHLAADPATKRLFLSAQDDNAVQVINLGMKEPLNVWLASPLKRPMEFIYFLEINSNTNYHHVSSN